MIRLASAHLVVAVVLGLAPAALAQSGGGANRFPDGPGKELVEGACIGCHQANMITRSSGYTREGWQELIGTMIDLSHSADTRDRIVQYLATQFQIGRAHV